MKRQTSKTGQFGLGSMIHVVHMTDDVPALNKFYDEVFSGLMYLGVDEPNYLPVEDRWAGLLVISDLCIETMAPADQGKVQLPVAKFYSKYGKHLHSVGYAVDDLKGLGLHLQDKGLYIGKPGGGKLTPEDEVMYFYPSPKDTYGLMVECCDFEMRGDPRLEETWSSQVKFWDQVHPLGIRRLSSVTLGVRDLEAAVARYVEIFEVVPVDAGVDEHDGANYQIVQMGDCLLKIAEPTDPNSALGQHVAKWGNMIYALTFQVHDLAAVEGWLNSKNVKTQRLTDDLVAADPEDCFGAPYFFTTRAVPNDPFEA